ncbi:C-factor, partial [Caligus rogercresseyi]
RQVLGNLTGAAMIEGFNVNCVAPTLLARGLLPLLKKASVSSSELGCHSATIIQMSTSMPPLGRIAWAALNMAMKNMSIDLKKDGILVMAMHPGWGQDGYGGLKCHDIR